jgi:hypothetical protein
MLINAQGFNREFKNIRQVLDHLGYIQIDTISVVQRAHHHVFWSRFANYRPESLDHLIKKRQAFEYWSHAASYLPMKDYRFSLYKKDRFRKRSHSYFPRDPKMMKMVLKRIESEGPLMARDFKSNPKNKGTGWWDWKPAKMALERLFLEGVLEVSSREGFQKKYDLSEKVIPQTINKTMPTDSQYCRYLIDRCLLSHGLATEKEITYLQKADVKKNTNVELKKLVDQRELVEVKIDRLGEKYYSTSQILNRKHQLQPKISLLSPFDNLVIQRKKLLNFFNFDYQIECYVPEKKRKYGYFTLPVLAGDKFIARVDCKAFRKEKVLGINSLHWENPKFASVYKVQLESKIKEFAFFNGCELSNKGISKWV